MARCTLCTKGVMLEMQKEKFKSLSSKQKKMLEILVGKPFEKITLADLDKISPGINKGLYKQAAKMIMPWLLSGE